MNLNYTMTSRQPRPGMPNRTEREQKGAGGNDQVAELNGRLGRLRSDLLKLGEDDARRGGILMEMGGVLARLGNHIAALDAYDRCRLAASAADPRLEARALEAIASIHFRRGEYPAALAAYLDCLRVREDGCEPELAGGTPGFYLEFQLPSSQGEIVDKLENRQGKFPIELVSVRPVVGEGGNTIAATVFVPERQRDYYLKKVAQYRDEDRIQRVEVDGQIVGFAIGDALDGNIWALFVHPGHAGQGHGRALFSTLVDWLRSKGLQRLTLGTEPDTRAADFYRAAGWTAVGLQDGEIRFERRFGE